jgi:glycosyltransferase involved in cell wall biosynthesis
VSKIFCIIPAWNEENNIKKAVGDAQPFVDEVVVVDDGSSDATSRKAIRAGATILTHISNRGQGAALGTGAEYALLKGADIIVHFDADGQFVGEEIKDVAGPIVEGQADIVFGSRFMGAKSNIPFKKKYLLLPLAHLVNRVLIGATLSDPQNGFRAMSADAARKIKIKQDDMAHCSEIIYKAFKNNLKIKEVPVTVIYHHFGSDFKRGIRIVKDLLLQKIISQ